MTVRPCGNGAKPVVKSVTTMDAPKLPFIIGELSEAAVRMDPVSKLVWTQQCIPEGGSPQYEWPVFRQAVREARLFVIGAPVLLRLYREAVKLTVQHLGGPDVEAPTLLPFEAVFLTTDDFAGECLTVTVGSVASDLIGFVLAIRGGVFRAWMIVRDRVKLNAMSVAVRTSGAWHGSDSLSSLVIPQLCDVVNYQPRVEAPLSFAARREWKRRAPAGTFPQPYYLIKSQLLVTRPLKVSGTPLEGRRHASPSYRFDSRSHRRLLLYRGPTPLQESDRAALTARGYQVFEQEISEPWREAMLRRGHEAQKPDEWIAVRYTHVRQSIKGAAHLPYLPSIHSIASPNPAEP